MAPGCDLARGVFWCVAAMAAALFWLVPHLPLIDIAQHAGQIQLLHDLVVGDSRWSDLLRINPFTPYYLGYGAALPLSFILPVHAVIAVLFTVGYVVWMVACVRLRRDLGGDPRLDWLFIVSFFGMAFQWGFMTFLMASGLGVEFIRQYRRHAQDPRPRGAILLCLFALCLFFSHGLVYAFGLWIAAGYACVSVIAGKRRDGAGARARILWLAAPLVFMVVFALIYYRVTVVGDPGDIPDKISFAPVSRRVLGFFAFPITGANDLDMAFLSMGLLALLASSGLRWNRESFGWWVFPAGVMLLWLFLPAYIVKTAMVYERFGLFILPAFAFALKRKEAPHKVDLWVGRMLVPALCLVVLAARVHMLTQWKDEAKEVDAVLAVVPPEQRVMSLMYSVETDRQGQLDPFGHYPSWYMAEGRGLVDFNFAVYLPQPVRYRPERLPKAIYAVFSEHPEYFDCLRDDGNDYGYILVRDPVGKPPVTNLAAQHCTVTEVANRGRWHLYKNHLQVGVDVTPYLAQWAAQKRRLDNARK